MRGRTLLLTLALLHPPSSTLLSQALPTRADSVLAAFVRPGAPGCAAAIDIAGAPAYRSAIGVAELEHGVPIAVNTIFEAGSVSKQFTAAAVLLLDARGVIDLDDPIQKWFPEIPEYRAPITLRHLMLHTSGLRDWGSVIGLTGWPRWTATYTHDDALAIIARQKGLNHDPGADFSYTNTGYNLLAMLVRRAAKVSLAEFTRREFFEPLGMQNTSWRDDYARVVRGRAQAYAPAIGGGWRLSMPFEQVYGNGGLLTTVDDLIRWNHALAEGRIGTPDVSAAMKTSGTFNDGSAVNYGGGLYLSPVRGVPAIAHGGATAGYRAVLAAYPEQRVDVAVLCNRADANPVSLAQAMLDGTVPFEPMPRPTPPPNPPLPLPFEIPPAHLGTWHSDETGGTLRTFLREGRFAVERRPGDVAIFRQSAADAYTGPGSITIRFAADTLYVSVSRALNVAYVRD